MSTTSVLLKLRRILQDMPESFGTTAAGDGQTTRFELPESPVDQITVLKRAADGSGVPTQLVLGVDYSVDAYNGIILLTAPLPVGQVLDVSGVFYETWADADLLDYIASALALHVAGRNPPVVLDPVAGAVPPTQVLNPVEERPLALLAARLVVEDQATAAARDITIATGDGTTVPRSQRYAQLIQEAARLDSEYESLVDRLGLPGYDTVTVTSLRRVSMTTNRLVPVYVPREWDDRTVPQRVLPQIAKGALTADTVVTYQGLYSSTRQYQVNDLVDENSQRYICTAPAQGIDPVADVAAGDGKNGLHWSLSYINSGVTGWYGGGW